MCMAAKRKTSSRRRSSTSKRGLVKRNLVKGRRGTFTSKRTATGLFKEIVERGRSLASDLHRRVTTKAKAGDGDSSDRAAA